MAVGRLKALFLVPGFAHYCALESLVTELLAARGQVLVAFEHQRGGLAPHDRRTLDDLRGRHPGFDHRQLRPRTGMWRTLAGATSRTIDYLRLLEPEYAAAEARRDRARLDAPRSARVLLAVPPFRWSFGRRALTWALRGLEAGIPAPRGVKALLSSESPDLLVVAPSAEFGAGERDWIRTADGSGIPWAAVFATEGELAHARGLPRGHCIVAAHGANGTRPDAAAGALEAVELAAHAPVEPGRRGRIARPLLWLLSPFIALALVLFRPRATGRTLATVVRRMSGRARKRARALRRRRVQRARARARADKAKRAARVEAARKEKAERAARAVTARKEKAERAARVEAARQEKAERARLKTEGVSATESQESLPSNGQVRG